MCTILIIAQFFHPFIISTSTCSAIKTKQKVNFTGSLSIFMFMYLWQIHSFRVSQEIILLLIHHRHHRRSSISAFLNFIIIENFYFLLCYTLSLSPRFCRLVHITSIKDPSESVASSISNKRQIKLWLD